LLKYILIANWRRTSVRPQFFANTSRGMCPSRDAKHDGVIIHGERKIVVVDHDAV
jgi:hypothetical protein